MHQYKFKVFVNARFDVIWQKLLDKIQHPEKYAQGIENVEILENEPDHVLRIVHFEKPYWQELKELKELIIHDKTTGMIVYSLVDHPYFQGETINICRTTNQVYHTELEYEINWILKDPNASESNEDKELAKQTLESAVYEMKRISEEAQAVYQ
jgi:hypothetical protein